MEGPKRVTSAEWCANTRALMDAHDLVEIVDDRGEVVSIYSCPQAPVLCDCAIESKPRCPLCGTVHRTGAPATIECVRKHPEWDGYGKAR